MRSRKAVSIALNNLVLIAIAVYFIAPMLWMWISAFRANPTFKIEFSDFTLQNFVVMRQRPAHHISQLQSKSERKKEKSFKII